MISLRALTNGWQQASTGGAGRQFLTYNGLTAYADFQKDWGPLLLTRDTSGVLGRDVLKNGSAPTGPKVPPGQSVRADLVTIWLDFAKIAWYRIGIVGTAGPGTAAPNALIVTYASGQNADLVISKAGYDGAYHDYHWEIENP